MNVLAFPTVLLSLLLLAGCAGLRGIVPQQSSMVEVRAGAGIPTDIRFDRNGDELWEYATGPQGTETYLVRFGNDGKVREVAQLLTQEQLMKVVPGTMTKADVRHLLGRPSDESFYRSGTVWSWRFRDGTQPGNLAVSFNSDNTVKDRMVLPDPSGGDRSRDDK